MNDFSQENKESFLSKDKTIQFYNSLSKKTESLPQKKTITIYSCGPTVYDFAHIGNFRTFLFEDLLIRTLKALDYKVQHTRNITDIDDKTIASSQEQKIPLSTFTEYYANAFFEDLEKLSFDQESTTYLKATDYISEMVTLIQELIQKDHAYETIDGVYFKTSSFSQYGDFAGLDLKNIQEGASGSNTDFNKEDFGDFVLWKKYKEKDENVYWDSPWGKGRPGWHTECAAMVRHTYPSGLDIHTGGIDLLFPHHTNEKAHCECLSHQPMAQFWLHATHLLVDNQKMSKSLGNFYTIRDLVQKGFPHQVIRFYLQTESHYRTPLNFTLEGLKGSESALKRINNFIHELLENSFQSNPSKLKEKFLSHLQDDLNISAAMGEIFTLINAYYGGEKIDTKSTLEELKAINSILAILHFPEEDILDPTIQKLVDLRIQARKDKDWTESDRLRNELLTYNIEVLDTKEGTKMRKKL